MTTPRINRKALAATLAPFALAAGILAPVAGASTTHLNAAPNAGASVHEVTKGFDVYNNTGQPLKLVEVAMSGDLNGVEVHAPDIGSVISPGGRQHFDVPFVFIADTKVDAKYESPDGTGPVHTAHFRVGMVLGISAVYADGGDPGGWTANRTWVSLTSPPSLG